MKAQYKRNIENAKRFAGQVIASVTECIGGKWQVCVNEYASMGWTNEYGSLPNPYQSMQTFDSEADAIAFANTFPLTQPVKVTKGGTPFYQDEHKWPSSND